MTRWLPWALWAGSALLCALTVRHGIQPNDEGLMLQAAARIAGGEVPYRDFWWFYPPGQPLVLAGLHALFGPSLVAWRVVRVAADATVALLAWRLALRGGAPPAAALAAWLAATLAMAYPSGPHPFPITLALCLGALLAHERHPAAAGALAGVAAFWRIEFAAYLCLGILLARPRLAFALAAAGVAAALYLPVVALAGPGRAFDLLIRYPVADFGDYQGLPFPLGYDGPLNTSSVGGFLADSAENLLVFYVPLVLVLGLAAGLLAAGLTRERWRVAPAVFALGMLHYLLARPDVFHAAPLAVMVAILAAWAAARITVVAVVALVALGCTVVEGLDRSWLVLREETVPLHVAGAGGIRVPPATARDVEATVRAVQARTAPGEPIYVATRRADLVTAGDPLLYVLARRPNPTRYDIQAPGVVTSAPVQREIVADLERTRPAVVVRDASPVTAAPEPNAAGRSSGVRLLDAYLARAYRPEERHGDLIVLARVEE
jgi:hypothetical protein